MRWMKKTLRRWRKKKFGGRRKNKLGMKKEQTVLHFSHDFHSFLFAPHPLISQINLLYSLTFKHRT